MSISGYGFEQTTFEARVDNLDVRRLVEQNADRFHVPDALPELASGCQPDMRLLLRFSHLPVYPANPACSLRSLYRCRSEERIRR